MPSGRRNRGLHWPQSADTPAGATIRDTMRRLFLAFFFLACAVGHSAAERRVALVFGIDAYRTIRPLANAVNDATTMSETLEELGFEVFQETNRDLRRMRRALDDFRDDAAGADVALVFFAGHGVETDGVNRLLPVDADASSLGRLVETSLALEEVVLAATATSKVVLILLDACRNDPFGEGQGGGRGASALPGKDVSAVTRPGLGRVGRAENVLFAFAAAPGATASDGAGGNSPFTAALAAYLGTKGVQVGSALKLVQQQVYDQTRGGQLPFMEDGLPALFFAAEAADPLPERERLLMAMADVSLLVRDEVEALAARRDMPLAPLYAALLSGDLAGLPAAQRGPRLEEAATAYLAVRAEMTALRSADPEVVRLRAEAEARLELGAFAEARQKLADAVAIDGRSIETLAANLDSRRLSKAGSHYLAGGASRAGFAYDDAIAQYRASQHLYEQIGDARMSQEDRLRHIRSVQAIANVLATTGRSGAAMAEERALLELVTKIAAAEPNNPEWARAAIITRLRVSSAEEKAGNLAAAFSMLVVAREQAEARIGGDPSAAVFHELLVSVLVRMSILTEKSRSASDALALSGDAVLVAQTMAGAFPGNERAREVQADALRRQGRLLGLLGRKTESESALAQASKLKPAAPRVETARETMASLLSRVRGAAGVKAGASAAAEAVAFAEAQRAADPDNIFWKRSLADALLLRGNLENLTRKEVDAEKTVALAIGLMEEVANADPGNAEALFNLAQAYADAFRATKDGVNIEPRLAYFYGQVDALRRLEKLDGVNVHWLRLALAARADLAVDHAEWGDFDAADATMTAVREAHARMIASEPDNISTIYLGTVIADRAGDVRIEAGEVDLALPFYREALAVRLDHVGQPPFQARSVTVSRLKIGEALLSAGRTAEAGAEFREALELTGRPAGADWPEMQLLNDRFLAQYGMAKAGVEEARHVRDALDTLDAMEGAGVHAGWVSRMRSTIRKRFPV